MFASKMSKLKQSKPVLPHPLTPQNEEERKQAECYYNVFEYNAQTFIFSLKKDTDFFNLNIEKKPKTR